MPQPTREEFNTAAQKVMASAPKGLSREDFYALIDKELAGGSPQFSMTAAALRAPHLAEGLDPSLVKDTKLTTGNASGEGPDQYKGPDTFAGGFLDSIKKQIVGQPGDTALTGAAHPSTVGDFLSLVLPSEVNELAPTAKAMGSAATSAAVDSKPGILNRLKAFTRNIYESAYPPKLPELSQPATSSTAPTVMQGEDAVDRAMKAARAEKAVSGARLVKGAGQTATPSLEDALSEALSGGAPPASEGGSSFLPPEQTTAGEGALKQSGKFGKSGNLGQAGGYTSGRSAITPSVYDALIDELGGKREDAVGAGVNPTSAPVESASPSAPHSADLPRGQMPRVLAWKEGFGPSEGDAGVLRDRFGAKDAAKILKTDPATIQELAPRMNPRALPSEVRASLDRAMAGMSQDEIAAYAKSAPNDLARAYIEARLPNP